VTAQPSVIVRQAGHRPVGTVLSPSKTKRKPLGTVLPPRKTGCRPLGTVLSPATHVEKVPIGS
jgi:hypothetical protein